jgi:hypothetical protein
MRGRYRAGACQSGHHLPLAVAQQLLATLLNHCSNLAVWCYAIPSGNRIRPQFIYGMSFRGVGYPGLTGVRPWQEWAVAG